MEKKRPYKNKVSFLLSEGGKERQLGWIGACCRLEKRGTWQVTPELCSAAETGGSGQEHGYCFRPRWWCGPLRRGFLPSTVDSPCSGILFFSLGQCYILWAPKVTRGETDDVDNTVYLWNLGILLKDNAFSSKEGALPAIQDARSLSWAFHCKGKKERNPASGSQSTSQFRENGCK